MNSTATNNIGYSGVVTLSKYVKSKKVQIAKMHNEGRKPLFNFLAECLLGNFDAAAVLRPTKIMLLNITTDNKEEIISSSSGFISYVTIPERADSSSIDGAVIKYSFIVPRAILQATTHEGGFTHIGLFNETDSDEMSPAAVVEINKEDANMTALTSSAVLVVDWELSLQPINSTKF